MAMLASAGSTPLPAAKNLRRAVDWEARDREMSAKVLVACERIRSLAGKPLRVTDKAITRIVAGKKISKYQMNKLPNTKAAIERASESVEHFRLRCVNYVIKQMLTNGRPLRRWEIVAKAGLNGACSRRVSREIEEALSQPFRLVTDGTSLLETPC